MHNEFALITIRVNQAYRLLKQLGICYGLLALITSSFILSYIFEGYTSFMCALFILCIHFSRKDKKFINISQISSLHIYMCEYTIICIPAFISIFLTKNYYEIILLLVTLLISVFIKNYTINSWKLSININFIVTSKNYEWKAGLRQYGSMLLLLLILTIGIMYLTNISYIVGIGILLITIVVSNFYLENESVLFLTSCSTSSKEFLRQALYKAISSFLFLTTPLFIFYLIFFHSVKEVTFMIYLYMYCLFCLSFWVFNKYAMYRPNSSFRINFLIHTLYAIFSLVPFFLPISIAFLYIKYQRAVRNLNFYF